MLYWILIAIILSSLFFILPSWIVTKLEMLENKLWRILVEIIGVVALGSAVLLIPFLSQPRLENFYLQYLLGIPLIIGGVILRFYAMYYFKNKNTTLELKTPSKLITTGPYSLVRHPMYTGSLIFILGWFLLWGGIYTILLFPLFIIPIYIQAWVEEKYILKKVFADKYEEYKQEVGMLFPKINK